MKNKTSTLSVSDTFKYILEYVLPEVEPTKTPKVSPAEEIHPIMYLVHRLLLGEVLREGDSVLLF